MSVESRRIAFLKFKNRASVNVFSCPFIVYSNLYKAIKGHSLTKYEEALPDVKPPSTEYSNEISFVLCISELLYCQIVALN